MDDYCTDRGDGLAPSNGDELLSSLSETRLVLDLARRLQGAMSAEAKRQQMGDCGVAASYDIHRQMRDGHRIVVFTCSCGFDLDEFLDRFGNP